MKKLTLLIAVILIVSCKKEEEKIYTDEEFCYECTTTQEFFNGDNAKAITEFCGREQDKDLLEESSTYTYNGFKQTCICVKK